MKKIILVAVFMLGLTSANAVVLEDDNMKCHLEACEAIHEAEQAFKGQEINAESVYSIVYDDCMEE